MPIRICWKCTFLMWRMIFPSPDHLPASTSCAVFSTSLLTVRSSESSSMQSNPLRMHCTNVVSGQNLLPVQFFVHLSRLDNIGSHDWMKPCSAANKIKNFRSPQKNSVMLTFATLSTSPTTSPTLSPDICFIPSH